MKNYLKFEKELGSMNMVTEVIESPTEISILNSKLKNGEPLGDDIIVKENIEGRRTFLRKYTNEEISALVEIRDLKSQQRIANVLTYFMILSVVSIAIVIIYAILINS